MAQNESTIRGIPGTEGRDYQVVRYNGRLYVVYRTKLPSGKWMYDAWRVSDKDRAMVNRAAGHVREMTREQFKNLNVFGDIGEIVGQGLGERPLQTWLKTLRETYGPRVSWLNDPEYMEIYFAGIMEGLDPNVITQQLSRTKWYQSRTAYQRQWETTMTKAERRTSTRAMVTSVTEALRELYGATFNLQKDAGITQKEIQKWAEDIASGKWGDPDSGFQDWLATQRQKAERVEGSQAWIDHQSAAEAQRAFLNRPEDMFQQIKDDATYWLGPRGVPSDKTLQGWSERLVSERASEADWQQFLAKQSSRLYPWLDGNTPWQEFADPYRRLVEETLGRSANWSDRYLRNLGGRDDTGKDTGLPVSFNDFELKLRRTDEFWSGPVASEEGFGLVNLLNETFQGVTG